jgi:hypothetical protein
MPVACTGSANVLEPGHVLRDAEPHGHVEDLLGQFDEPVHLRTAAGEHDAAGHQVLEAAAAQLALEQVQQFLVAGLDHLGEGLAGELAGGRSPMLGTSMSSLTPLADRAQAWRTLMSSACWVGVRSATAMSLVT